MKIKLSISDLKLIKHILTKCYQTKDPGFCPKRVTIETYPKIYGQILIKSFDN